MRSHAIVGALYLAAAIGETWPLLRHLGERIAHDPGDPLLIAYLLNWNARVLPLSPEWWHPPFFWPNERVMTLSEPFLGLAPAAWLLTQLGANPAAVYNLLLIAALWLAPLGAYFLVHTLTRNTAASFIAGLAFGYAPYRAAQLSHLQLLLVPAVPLILLALHRATGAHTLRWVAAAAALWLWQTTTSLYFLLFIPLTLAVWLPWFAGVRSRVTAQTVVAFAAAGLVALPLIAAYRAAHDAHGYSRSIGEVITQSADVKDVAYASPDLAVSAAPPATTGPEHNLFPGFVILALALIAVAGIRFSTEPFRAVTLVFLALFAAASVLAVTAMVHPLQTHLAGAEISLTSPHKPLTLAWLALFGAALSSRTLAAAWRERSAVVGYLVLAVALWILSLGPEPAIDGNRIWYRAPYWFLFEYVPGFDGVRVPARLWTIVTLCLAVVAGLGAERLLRGRFRPAVAVALATAILAEGSIALHFDPLPRPIAVPADARVVLELPAGDAFGDTAAMYRSVNHGRPVLNGYSGYHPPSYVRLLADLEKGDADAIVAAAGGQPVAVVVNPGLPRSAPIYAAVERRAAACTHGVSVLVCLLRP